MQNEALQHFQTLKLKLQAALQATHPHFTRELHEWTSQEITTLQEALNQKVQGYVSEKWFYTHLKPLKNDKLPRIDMLNMLSRFLDYENWQDFVFQHSIKQDQKQEDISHPEKRDKKALPWQGLAGAVLVLTIVLGVWAMIQKPSSFKTRFCFQDADTKLPITKDVEVFWLKAGESPKLYKVNRRGCVKIVSKEALLTLVVKARYYRTDTIVRQLEQPKSEELITLRKDDYALLIHLISKPGKTLTQRQQRRKQLDKMIDAEAQIFQVDESGLGVELYSKTDFIDRLSLPIGSLKNLEVIETKYQQGKITLLRFLQKDK
jgi:hypothetical protein